MEPYLVPKLPPLNTTVTTNSGNQGEEVGTPGGTTGPRTPTRTTCGTTYRSVWDITGKNARKGFYRVREPSGASENAGAPYWEWVGSSPEPECTSGPPSKTSPDRWNCGTQKFYNRDTGDPLEPHDIARGGQCTG